MSTNKIEETYKAIIYDVFVVLPVQCIDRLDWAGLSSITSLNVIKKDKHKKIKTF